MRIQEITLKGFKRFDDLTISLGDHPARIVALVGPNGCGKSCVFDAFEERLKDLKGARQTEPESYYSKYMFHSTPAMRSMQYNKNSAVSIKLVGNQGIGRKTFHIRSPYRFTPSLNVQSVTAQPDILDDGNRPGSSSGLDNRLKENYERLLGIAYAEFERGTKTGDAVRSELLDEINQVLEDVLDVRVSSLGNVTEHRGMLYFSKDDAQNFPYQNLSSGEKEVIDLVVDIVVRKNEFDDTAYCIDEPELHINTAIQRKLLLAIERLIPENCQLWVATHSIGFLRALQNELADKCAILDFSEKNYSSGTQVMEPIAINRSKWRRIFNTALDDLTGLVAPERLIYCEGRPEPGDNNEELGLDARVYNEVFEKTHPSTLFVSSGGTNEVERYSQFAVSVLSKAFIDVELLHLRDRDTNTDEARLVWLNSAPHHRMLLRREIENYLFDFDVLAAYCQSKARPFNHADYNRIVNDILMQDLKAGTTTYQIKVLCGEAQISSDSFKRTLARFIAGTPVFDQLRLEIFEPTVQANVGGV